MLCYYAMPGRLPFRSAETSVTSVGIKDHILIDQSLAGLSRPVPVSEIHLVGSEGAEVVATSVVVTSAVAIRLELEQCFRVDTVVVTHRFP